MTNGTSFFVSFFYGKATGGLRFFSLLQFVITFATYYFILFIFAPGFFSRVGMRESPSRGGKNIASPPLLRPCLFAFFLLFWENVPICHRRNSRFLAGFFFVLFSEKSMCRRRPSPYDVKGQ